MKPHIKELIAKKKIIAICRGIYGDDLEFLAESLNKGGIDMIEVTFDQNDPCHLQKTSEAISMLCKRFPNMGVGAGTVVLPSQLDAAATGGAEFIISPNTDADIIKETKRRGLISIPGAMTPTEIAAAWRTGADFVKLFPCDQLGVAYVKAVMSPLNNIPLMATGGIDAQNLETYLSIGMAGAGMGGKLCNKQLIRERNAAELEALARTCSAIAQKYS